MCGRVRLSSDVSEIKLVFSIPPHRPTANFPPGWNVAPTDPLRVVRFDAKAGERSLDVLRWVSRPGDHNVIMPRMRHPIARCRDFVIGFYIDIGEACLSMKCNQSIRIVNTKAVLGAVEGPGGGCHTVHASDDAEAVWSQYPADL